NNAKNALEENDNVQATPVDSNKALERNAQAPSLEKVTQAVQNINKSLQAMSRDLEFSVDSDSNRTIVKVVDRKTKEVIRQIPSHEALEISKALDTAVHGLLMKQQA
ncbi:MAG: flagellar protein FlaG, partial [Burkholderiales bacterium]|nr:flagellar protein FlaG [Burkholderiales bacterium]